MIIIISDSRFIRLSPRPYGCRGTCRCWFTSSIIRYSQAGRAARSLWLRSLERHGEGRRNFKIPWASGEPIRVRARKVMARTRLREVPLVRARGSCPLVRKVTYGGTDHPPCPSPPSHFIPVSFSLFLLRVLLPRSLSPPRGSNPDEDSEGR